MLRYTGLHSDRIFSKLYVEGGMAYRKVDHVRTTTDYSKQVPSEATTTSSSNIPTPLGMSTLKGAVVAVGFRFVDDFNIRVTPEIRYTRWQGRVLNGFLTDSRPDQFDVGVGLTF
jgi:hypothetical protein